MKKTHPPEVHKLVVLLLLVTYSLVAWGADCTSTTPIGPNQKIIASLDGSECLVSDILFTNANSYYDLYFVTLKSAGRLTVTMGSDAIQGSTYLELYEEEWLSNTSYLIYQVNVDAESDNPADEAMITVHLEPGNYIILANSWNDYETGAYVLETVTNYDDPTYVDLSGTIKTDDGTDICAMVLASGQFMFSCNPIGVFSLTDLPRENDGTVKRQIYADGFFPKVDVLTDSGSEAVVMTRSGTCPNYNTFDDPAFVPGSSGKRIDISGKILLQDSETALCAMALANGQYTFTCNGSGDYALNIPLDTNGQFKLQVYADGFAPLTQKFDEFSVNNDVRMARALECQ
jgi:hypothetical protein